MSALTDLFTAMANKIRSKTGTATTYTPSEMASDGIDDVYDAGVASATTSITPSNASPVSMSANTGYKPTTAGYAIESYSNISPTSGSAISLSAGSIYKVNSAGKAIKSYTSVTPNNSNPPSLTSNEFYGMGGAGYAIASYSGIVPSNISPATLTDGDIGKVVGGNGYAIESYSSVTPSNSSPVTLSSGSIYKMSGSGKAVASVTSKTPSDSNPPSVASGDIIKPSANGYLVENAPIDMSNPDVTWEGNLASNGSKTITVTQKPRLVIASTSRYGDSNGYFAFRVNDVANDKNCNAYYGSSGYVENLNVSGLTSITVSDTSVVYNSNRSYTTRNAVFIWY